MKTIVFSKVALSHLDKWKSTQPRIAIKIVALITEIAETPFTGTGKPEPLKHELKGKWSRRITREHRLVYEVTEKEIRILSCKFHYD
jgi:toxin YoeB